MKRRSRLAWVVTGMVAALLLATPAVASASATARLTSPAAVYPGSYAFTLRLKNTDGLLVTGETINYFTVELPQAAGIVFGEGTEGTPTAGNFTARKVKLGGKTDAVVFENGTLLPGTFVDVNIPAVAQAPSSCDRTGTWRLRVSSDGGATLSNAEPTERGALDSRVMILEILASQPVAPFDPVTGRGVRDGTGTAGQTVGYDVNVTNHALKSVTTTTSLSSSHPSDVPGNAVTRSIGGGGGTQLYNVTMKLGQAPAQRTSIFSAHATTSCATAPPLGTAFTVQVPVDLAFTALAPTRVRSGPSSATTFTATVAKTGNPGFELKDGRLTFPGNKARLQNAPIVLGPGTQTLALRYAIGRIKGTERTHPASISSVGEDFNLAPLSAVTNAGDITIDTTPPVVTITEVALPRDADGDRQVAVKSGDTVVVQGDATGQHTGTGSDVKPGTLQICLESSAGPRRCVAGRLEETSWTATFTGGATQWSPNETSFAVSASVRDEAGNEGTAFDPGPFRIDLVPPALGGYASEHKGVVVTATMISVRFIDNLNATVRGGCDASSWLLDGVVGAVTEVRLSDGSRCSGSDADADAARRRLSDGVRLLVLDERFAQQPHQTPEITYDPRARHLGFYPAKDGASNDAAGNKVKTVNKVVPPTPNIDCVERRDGTLTAPYENAYLALQENRYYTNVGGGDGVRVCWSFTLPLLADLGGDAKYHIRVTDHAGDPLRDDVEAGRQDLLSGRFTGTIAVPLPSEDGVSTRRLHVVSPSGVTSPAVTLDFALDTVRPTLDARVFDGAKTVDVRFTERIVGGTNFASDWTIGYEIRGEAGPEIAYTTADTVSVVDQMTRRLTISLPDPGAYRSTDYVLLSGGGRRYEDRAGNAMADTVAAQ